MTHGEPWRAPSGSIREDSAGARAAHDTGALAVAVMALCLSVATLCLAAAPSLQVYFAADFKDQAYRSKVFKRVAGSWSMPAETPKPGGKAVVVVTIRRGGETSGTRLHHRSGSDAWDAAAIQTLSKAAPFDPLPKSYAPDSVEVHFHFAYAD